MNRYKVCGQVTVGAWTLVEAESEADALAIARSREAALAPDGCSRNGVDPTESVVVENADGEMRACRIEPMDQTDEDAWEAREDEFDGGSE